MRLVHYGELICCLLSALLPLFLLACGPDPEEIRQMRENAYAKGRDTGKQQGYEEGYQKGYEEGYQKGSQDGFQKALPGRESRLPGFWGHVQTALVFLGAVKITFALFFVMGYLTWRKSRSRGEQGGKLLMAGLGFMVVFWFANFFGFSEELRSTLLAPASTGIIGWLAVATTSFLTTYVLFSLFHRLFIKRSQGPLVEAWCVFIASAATTILVPVFIDLMKDVPDINRYLASELIFGTFIGGVYYVAWILIRAALEDEDVKNSQTLASSAT